MGKALKILLAAGLLATFSLPAASVKRGKERLRELAVFPELSLQFRAGFTFREGGWVIATEGDTAGQINELRAQIKQEPDNVRKLMQLGDCLNESGQTNEASTCYQKAEQICRRQIAAHPQNGLHLTELGAVLSWFNKLAEGESAYRNAVLVSSNDWKCWVGLGHFLNYRAYATLIPTHLQGLINFSSSSVPQEIVNYRPTLDALKTSESMSKEAAQCLERAVSLATNESQVYLQRAGARCQASLQDCFVRHIRNNDPLDTTALRSSILAKSAIADFQKAAELSPKEYRLTGVAAWFEFSCALVENKGPLKFESLPDPGQQSIRRCLTRLEGLGQNADRTLAAGALETLGFVEMVMGDLKAAKARFQQTVTLDPSREQSWEMWLGTAVESGSTPAEIQSICEKRLKQKNSARNHLLLSKAFAKQERWEAAGEQAQLAARMDAKDVAALLMTVALNIRQSANTNLLSAAASDLERAQELYHQMPYSDEKPTRWRESLLNAAIVYGLFDRFDQARETVEPVLKHDPNDADAKEILKALQGME